MLRDLDGAPPELECGREPRGMNAPEAGDASELVGRCAREIGETTGCGEQLGRVCRLARTITRRPTCTDEHVEELAIRERGDAAAIQPITWTFEHTWCDSNSRASCGA